MPLKVKCPEDHVLTVPVQRAGSHVRCPICMQTVYIERDGPASQSEQSRATKNTTNEKKATPRSSARAKQKKSRAEQLREASVAKAGPEKLKKKKSDAKKKQPSQNESDAIKPSTDSPDEGDSRSPSPKTPRSPVSKRPAHDAKQAKRKLRDAKDTSRERTKPEPSSNESAKKEKRHRPKETPAQVAGKARKKTLPTDSPAAAIKTDSGEAARKSEPPVATKPTDPLYDQIKLKGEAKEATADSKPEPARQETSDAVSKQASTERATRPPTSRSSQLQPSRPPDEVNETKAAAQLEETLVLGLEYEPAKRWTAYYLAIALVSVGLLNMGPAVMAILAYYDPTNIDALSRWAYAALFIGAIQIFYGIYLAQLPDWSTVWVAAVLTLLIATGYAMLLGMVWFGGSDAHLVAALDLADASRGKARLWCFTMLSTTSLLAYFCGKEGVRWHRAYAIQRDIASGTA